MGISDLTDERLSTPYESWCERQGLHAEAPGAFDQHVSTIGATPT
ncbi:hypothetical protein [Nocardioides marmotae]|nr:hypothetical protein [Nocardioides marmotae]